ncbi:MAG: glucose-6-phosphate isomerase [Desulfovibrionales bacterium]|nr:glucose-6-phosphate isomerase [Desulfovibrionales bacterium]
MKKWEDKKWVSAQRIRVDFNYDMAEFVGGDNGISNKEIRELEPKAKTVHNQLLKKRSQGVLAFYDLPYEEKEAARLVTAGRKIGRACRNFVVLGIGGSALGGIALQRALNHPHYNLLSDAERKHRPRLFFADNIDPDGFQALLDILGPSETVFNVISKSGGTAETMSQFIYVRDRLIKKLGKERHRSHIVVTTDPEKGRLREIAERENYLTFPVPAGVGGRFSVLTPVGLLPAAVAGIDISMLLAGARDMDGRCRISNLWKNPAYLNAVLYYLADTKKGKPIAVMMPYADALYGVADWFRQLWAESLGKRTDLDGNIVSTGQTPVRALGATDQHSQLQLYMEGPNNKLITFLVVERLRKRILLPRSFADMEGVSYLGGHSLNELIAVEQKTTELALTRNKRPNLSIIVPEVNAFTLGQLLFMLEVQTVFAGGLYHINPLDQPGVEEGKQFAYGLMGRNGFEHKAKEFAERPEKSEKYII